MKQSKSNEPEKLNREEIETINSLLNYPSLEKVFDPTDSRSPSEMKQKMQSTIDDLERVIRRGTKGDAEKAARAVEAYKTVLGFLDELETARQAQAK